LRNTVRPHRTTAAQVGSFLGCAAAVLPLALAPHPSVPLAVACLTGALALYALSAAGFHSHLQDVAGAHAGAVFGLTNSASIAAGIAGNLLTGLVLERGGGAPAAVFGVFAALNLSGAALFGAATSKRPLAM
jgi:predicted MFS family arabinose efflux permease